MGRKPSLATACELVSEDTTRFLTPRPTPLAVFPSVTTTLSAAKFTVSTDAQPRHLIGPDTTFALPQIVAALSTALDLTEGQPENHSVRSCLIALRLGREIGLSPQDEEALLYAVLLKDLGCSSNAAKMCWLFGADERRVKHDLKTVNWQKAASKFGFAVRHVAPGESTIQKVLRLVAMAREGESGERKLVEIRCERGAEIAANVGLPAATSLAIKHLDEHWNGGGHPSGLKGEEISLLGRIAGLVQTVDVFVTADGLDAGYAVARERRGTWFDPELVTALESIRGDAAFWQAAYGPDPRAVLEAWDRVDSGTEIITADSEQLDRLCLGFAQVVDAKSPWTFRHSERVAEIAAGVSRELGGNSAVCRDVYLAGLMHDLGKLGVSNMILDKPGKPTDDEFAEIRKHPDLSEQVLRRVDGFARFADVACAHHERLDGRGYHRRLPDTVLPFEARILAVADVFEALTANRPYRDGMPAEKAFDIMRRDLGTAFDHECFAALLRHLEKTTMTSRVEDQLAAIEKAHSG